MAVNFAVFALYGAFTARMREQLLGSPTVMADPLTVSRGQRYSLRSRGLTREISNCRLVRLTRADAHDLLDG